MKKARIYLFLSFVLFLVTSLIAQYEEADGKVVFVSNRDGFENLYVIYLKEQITEQK